MNLSELLQLYINDSRTARIGDFIASTRKNCTLDQLKSSAIALQIAAVYKKYKGNHIIIAQDKEQAAYWYNDLQNILERKDILFFPELYKQSGQIGLIDPAAELHRTEAINQLHYNTTNGELLVTYSEAIFTPVIRPEELLKQQIHFKVGSIIELDVMIDVLVSMGYDRVDFVYEPGEFSIRGGIFDIYSMIHEHPYRIECISDEVASIRTFEPESQHSIKKINEIRLVPTIQQATTRENQINFFELFDHQSNVWLADAHYTQAVLDQCKEKTVKSGAWSQDNKNNSGELFLSHVKKFHTIHIFKNTIGISDTVIDYKIKNQQPFQKKFELLIQSLQEHSKNKIQNIICSDSPRQLFRLHSILEDMHAKVVYQPLNINLHQGFIDSQLNIALYTDHQIFERFHKYAIRENYSRNQAITLREIKNLSPGDFVTHIDHGIGRFSGLEKLTVNGNIQEMVRIIYLNNDLLYINISALNKISKYVGKDGTAPKLNKLGGDAWEQLKRKAKKQVKDIAKDLITLYAKRKTQKGFAFAKDSYLQNEMEATFMFEDTPDQIKATIEIKKDMESPVPMDRLVCGDVGFGKTEIAMRAAFKAVCDSKQVAILVPTTILAMQHYKSFRQRFENFPVTIDYINRFKTTKEKTTTIKKIQEGKTDIIIGTHALLSEKIKFKDLGLFIIDEEQKFGVTAKEKIKTAKINVDTLTLSATPIPRTLQFSMMGARDLCIMNTAPANRQSIDTRLHTFSLDIIREAIYNEIQRGGQVFVIHNRVKDINDIADKIKQICPNIDIGVAHGQMNGIRLELEMLRFIDKECDVLISTNIIESGLDIPNANTIIINNAHYFGLSDLHQLRGRVGRSNKKAFCHLLSPPLSSLPPDARRRLQTLEQYSELGSGMSIALRDMDIRGAGNLLGAEQSGFIADIGYETFHKILNEAIQELKETDFKELFIEDLKQEKKYVRDCSVETDLEMWIPDDYISNINERIAIYTELNTLENENSLLQFMHQLTDRFGVIPAPVLELLDAIRLQWIAKQLGIEKIILKNNVMRCVFIKNEGSIFYESEAFDKIIKYIQMPPCIAKLEEVGKSLQMQVPHISSIHQAKEFLEKLIP